MDLFFVFIQLNLFLSLKLLIIIKILNIVLYEIRLKYQNIKILPLIQKFLVLIKSEIKKISCRVYFNIVDLILLILE